MRSAGGAPGPSGAGPRRTSSWKAASCSESTAAHRPARSPNARNSVPLPTPASWAMTSIETFSGPRSSNSRAAVQSTRSWLRIASARRRGCWPATGSSTTSGSCSRGLDTLFSIASGPRSVCRATVLISKKRTAVRQAKPQGDLQMSTITTGTGIGLPAGTYKDDGVHSAASFAVKHMVVSTFRGRFEDFNAVLTVGEDGTAHLDGTVDANTIVVKDENLAGHLKSPDFFDTERYPEIKFSSLRLTRDGDDVTLEGDLTIKGHTEKVTGKGTIEGPHEDIAGNTKVGLALETVIDRTKFGLNWNAPLPKGGFALADDVKLTVELELAKA